MGGETRATRPKNREQPPVVMPKFGYRKVLAGKALVTGANSGIGKAMGLAMGRPAPTQAR